MNIRTVLLCVTLIGIPFALTGEPVTREESILQDLKSLIDQADVQGFKTLMGMTIIPEEGTATTLLNYAQEKRNTLQQQHASLPDNAKEYKYLAKGVGQCYLGLCCGVGGVLATALYAAIIAERKFNMRSIEQVAKIARILYASWIASPPLWIVYPIGQYVDRKDFNGNELSATAAYAIPALLAYFSAKYFCRFGKQNIKQGWHYKAHLENQIKNLDEIIAYIQEWLSPTIAPAIEEQI